MPFSFHSNVPLIKLKKVDRNLNWKEYIIKKDIFYLKMEGWGGGGVYGWGGGKIESVLFIENIITQF